LKRLLSIIGICALLYACVDDERWTTDTSATLTFSQDTVAFDTLISTIGSATRTLVVSNPSDRGVRLSRVFLLQGSKSPFRVNVDGQYLAGGVGEDFEVRHGDSIVVRIEVTPPLNGCDTARQYVDQLAFRLESGIEQRVHLSVGSQDAHFLHGWVICSDDTLTAGMPYVVYDSLVVDTGAILTVDSGVQLLFHDKAGLLVRGTLHAGGSLSRPVIFRGDRTDHLFDYLLYDNTPSRWEGLTFTSTSHDNYLSYCDIHGSRYGIVCDSTTVERDMLVMDNSIVHNIGGDGLQLNHCKARFTNTQVSNTLGRTVNIFGGEYDFVYCTIAQFYPFDSKRQDALYIANQIGDNYRPLYRAHFLNSVVTGYAEDVIMGSISEGQDEPCDYLFDHCYLKTVASDDSLRFRHVLYEDKDMEPRGSDNFRLFDTDNFIYDFTPDSLSRIRNMADSTLTDIRYDRLGRSRTLDEAPDAGCYEWKE